MSGIYKFWEGDLYKEWLKLTEKEIDNSWLSDVPVFNYNKVVYEIEKEKKRSQEISAQFQKGKEI